MKKFHFEAEIAFPKFSEVRDNIKRVIFTQKFEGASAGLLNSSIIARELGLADKKEIDAKVALTDDFDALRSESLPKIDND